MDYSTNVKIVSLGLAFHPEGHKDIGFYFHPSELAEKENNTKTVEYYCIVKNWWKD